MSQTVKIIISKSSKKKMSSLMNHKANARTQQVVYHQKINGKMTSKTKHEIYFKPQQ